MTTKLRDVEKTL